MAIDISALLMLQKDPSDRFTGGREISHIIQLDEGHDRPVWEWVKRPGGRVVSRGVIPSGVSQILFDGVKMLADELTGTAASPHVNPGLALKGYELSILTFEDSSVAEQIAALSELDIKVRWFQEGVELRANE